MVVKEVGRRRQADPHAQGDSPEPPEVCQAIDYETYGANGAGRWIHLKLEKSSLCWIRAKTETGIWSKDS
jgi:hypothetical protein